MNQIEIFKNPEFGAIRAVEIDGEPWLVGKDVALALGYTNPQKAIRDHVDAEDRTVNDSFTVNGTAITLINESGLYSLVLSSKLPKAKQFRRWVTSEVLPTIRKYGAYMTREKLWEVATSPEALMKLCSDLLAEREENAVLREENALLEGKAAFFDLFAGVLGKGCCQRIRITTFEKDQVLGRGAAAVFLHRIIHTVFPGDFLKLLDGGIGYFDIGNALVLTNELLDRLLTLGLHRRVPASLLIQLLFLAMGKVFTNGGLKQPPGELCAVDYQRQSPVFHFFLHFSRLLSADFAGGVLDTKAGPPAAAEDNASYRPP